MGVNQSIIGQCQIENGNFNLWEDVSEELEDDLGVTLDTAIYLPQHFVAFLRVFAVTFSELFFELLGEGNISTEIAQQLYGIQRYVVDETVGDYALSMKPDSLLNFVDILKILPCDDNLESISFDLKYEGEGADSLLFFFLVGEGDPTESLFTVNDFTDIADAGFIGAAVNVYAGGPAVFEKQTLPIEYNPDLVNDPERPDSALLLIIAMGDSVSIAQGLNGKYVIDNIQTKIASSSALTVNESLFTVSPNPTTGLIQIGVDNIAMAEYSIFNNIGAILKQGNISGNTQLNLSDLPTGMYYLKINHNREILTKKIVIK